MPYDCRYMAFFDLIAAVYIYKKLQKFLKSIKANNLFFSIKKKIRDEKKIHSWRSQNWRLLGVLMGTLH